jgi:hypothetical protein
MFRLSVLALLLSASGAQAFAPVVCTSKGDREWTIDGKTISAQLRATKAIGVLKDERTVDVGDAKQWLVEFNGLPENNRAFLTVAGGRYLLVFADGQVTEGTCVSRSALQQ